MIKRTFFFVIALAISLCTSAQVLVDDNENEVQTTVPTHVYKNYVLSVGSKIGGNYSFASDPSNMNLGIGGNIGYSAGVAANIRFARPIGKPFGTERFGVQIEALYSIHSLKTDDKNIDMNSYEVPVLFQWYFYPSICLEVGPTFTGVLSAKPSELKYNNAIYHTDKIKGNDIMLTLGIGYKNKSGLSASVRYNMGGSDLAGNFKTKVSTMSVGIGWLFSVVK